MNTPEPPNTFVVRDYDTLKVIADPLRTQIVEMLLHAPMNVKQVAERLGLAPSKLYYHFGLLEKIGLVLVADTRQIANIVEKTYKVAAANIEVDPALFNFNTQAGQESLHTALVATLRRRATLSDPLDEAWVAVQGILDGIDFTIILSPLVDKLDEIEVEFFASLGEVESAFDQMLSAGKQVLGDASVSVSVGT